MSSVELMKCEVYKSMGKLRFVLESNASIVDSVIKDYVDRYNQGASVLVNPIGDFPLLIAFHGFKDMFNGPQSQYDFAQDKNKDAEHPIIHLTPFNVFKSSGLTEKEEIVISGAKRYQKIMDSSIWNYFVPVFPSMLNLDREIKFERFDYALSEIYRNTKDGLYGLAITHEYANLNARLLEQSFLIGSHNSISPFLFHSEYEMKEMFDGFGRDENRDATLWKDEVKKFKWRFLLLDDRSIQNLKSREEGGDGQINKLSIISNAISHIFGLQEEEKKKIWFRHGFREIDDITTNKKKWEPQFFGRFADGVWTSTQMPKVTDDIWIVIDCAKTLQEAMSCLQNYRYEIVLLDYLLEKDEYGYKFLKELWDWNKIPEETAKPRYLIGPNRRCFFMFISAFTTAVHERMLEQGLNFSEPGLWYIGDGACPTNTPYLFAYQLLLLMQHRLTDLRKEKEGGFFTIIDLLERIYVKGEEQGTVRDKAHKRFNQVLFMRAKYKKLESDLIKEDEEKIKRGISAVEMMNMSSSFLVYHTFKVVHHFSGAFFEHLQHLVYLTAFGTIRQWEDMWEEYIFIRKELCNYDDIVSGKKPQTIAKERGRGRVICDAIRDYIIDLKENNYR